MKALLSKLSSRKFLTALVAQIASIVAFFSVETGDAVADLGTRIVALVVLVIAALGYGIVEASVDRKGVEAEADVIKAQGADWKAGDKP